MKPNGLKLRDWFAGMAMAGAFANPENVLTEEGIAESAYVAADAMLAERKKNNEQKEDK